MTHNNDVSPNTESVLYIICGIICIIIPIKKGLHFYIRYRDRRERVEMVQQIPAEISLPIITIIIHPDGEPAIGKKN